MGEPTHTPDPWERPAARAGVRPLRIVMLGWARLDMQEREGSGYNLSASELAVGLVRLGHRVTYLRSGIDFGVLSRLSIRSEQTWRDVWCGSVRNSPNLATGNLNARALERQASAPELEGMLVRYCQVERADVVHVHSFEGWSFGMVAALRRGGIPVVVTPHNYFALCPQVDLLHAEREVCVDYEGGGRCEGCIAWIDPRRERRERGWRQSMRRALGRHSTTALRDLPRAVVRRLGWGEPEEIHDVREAGLSPTRLGGGSVVSPHEYGEADAEWRLKLTRRSDVHLRVLSLWGERRRAGVGALNAASRVLCPGRFLMEVHAAFGVDPAKMRHVPPGQPHFDVLRERAERSVYYDVRSWDARAATRPLRLAYFGSTAPHKGLGLLVDAYERLDPGVRDRLHLVVRAGGDDRWARRRLVRCAGVEFGGGYDLSQLVAALDDTDAVVFPNLALENSPFVVLEALHRGRLVIASRLGACEEMIAEGRNGLLVAPGNPEALASAIARVVEGAVPIPTPREVHSASRLRSNAEYLADVEGELVQAANA